MVTHNPLLNAFSNQDVPVLTNIGKNSMKLMVEEGEKIARYKASGAIRQDEGNKAGTAYRMKDGSIVYVSEGKE